MYTVKMNVKITFIQIHQANNIKTSNYQIPVCHRPIYQTHGEYLVLTLTLTFMHFIQSDLHCIQAIHIYTYFFYQYVTDQ